MYDFQKADMWKRLSAWLFDFIIIGIVMVGIMWGLSVAFKYDVQLEQYNAAYEEYKTEFGRDTSMSQEEYAALSPEDSLKYQQIRSKMWFYHETSFNLSLLIPSLAIILAYFIMEFVIPLFIGNGQTLGKKIFGIGVMRADGVRITPFMLFVRSMLGKCTIETLVPVAIVVMIVFRVTGIVGLAVLAALLLSQIVLVVATKARTPIHDMFAQTVTVDMASQMIFDTPEELLVYKQKIHAEMVSDMKETYNANN